MGLKEARSYTHTRTQTCSVFTAYSAYYYYAGNTRISNEKRIHITMNAKAKVFQRMSMPFEHFELQANRKEMTNGKEEKTKPTTEQKNHIKTAYDKNDDYVMLCMLYVCDTHRCWKPFHLFSWLLSVGLMLRYIVGKALILMRFLASYRIP